MTDREEFEKAFDATQEVGVTVDLSKKAIMWEGYKMAIGSKKGGDEEPVAYLTWHCFLRAPDDGEEYLAIAEKGEKSCDGTPAIPVYTALQQGN